MLRLKDLLPVLESFILKNSVNNMVIKPDDIDYHAVVEAKVVSISALNNVTVILISFSDNYSEDPL